MMFPLWFSLLYANPARYRMAEDDAADDDGD